MNWYARKLAEQGTGQPVQPHQPAPTHASYRFQSQQSPVPTNKRQQAEEALRNGDIFGAASAYEGGEGARNVKECPECQGMMFRPSLNAVPQCFNCGWNPRFHQKA